MKVLYTTCHAWLERSDYQIFKSIGFDVFSTGYFQDPKNPTSKFVDPLPYEVDKDLYNEFKKLNPNYEYGYKIDLNLTKDFVNKFDIIVVSWRYDYLQKILPLRGENQLVVFQTVGQSDPSREVELKKVSEKYSCLRISRISESERAFPNYAGADYIIDLAINTDQFKPWSGSSKHVLSVNKMMWRTKECNVNEYLAATAGFPRKFYGKDNEKFNHDFSLGPISPADLIEEYSMARVCFCLGTKPAPTTLGFKQAMASGCPVITWGPKLGNGNFKTYVAYKYIENGVNGFYSDNIGELRGYIQSLFDDYDLAKNISNNAIKTAKDNFDIEVIAKRWSNYLRSEYCYG